MTRSKYHYWYWDEVPCLIIRRRRSRSMNPSPSKLLEEYKMKWTCKVNAGICFFRNPNPGHFQICLVAEVEVILQPCGHLCLCEPCSLSIRRRFFFALISLIYFSENALAFAVLARFLFFSQSEATSWRTGWGIWCSGNLCLARLAQYAGLQIALKLVD